MSIVQIEATSAPLPPGPPSRSYLDSSWDDLLSLVGEELTFEEERDRLITDMGGTRDIQSPPPRPFKILHATVRRSFVIEETALGFPPR